MTKDNLERKNKELLKSKLQEVKKLIDLTMNTYKLKSDDHIVDLVKGIGNVITDFQSQKYEAERKANFINHFIYDIKLHHYNHIRDIMFYIMRQDYLDMEDRISSLQTAVNWRMENFDDYWKKMENGLIDNKPLK